jgi:hypothetical protein
MPRTRRAGHASRRNESPETLNDTQHDTTISFIKPIQIFDGVVGIPKVPNITTDPSYARLVTLIEHLRERLMQDEVLREPLLHVLKSLYKSNTTRRKISRIRPTQPTDQDIIRFVDEFWPDLYLVAASRDSERSGESNTGGSGQWDGVWSHTYSGVASVPNAQVQIIAPLIEQWQSHVSTPVHRVKELLMTPLTIARIKGLSPPSKQPHS